MTRHHHPTLSSLVHRLRPSPASFAAAAAVYEPRLLLALQATQRRRATAARPPVR